MNAIPPISPAPSGSDAAQLNAPASAASPPLSGANRDFAGALRDAGGKPIRKGAVNKPHEATLGGSALPAPGNPPPPVPASAAALTPSAPLPAVKADLLAAAQAADAAGVIAGPPGAAAGPDPGANGVGPGLAGQAGAGSTAALPIPAIPDLAAAPVSAPKDASPGAARGPAAGSASAGIHIPAALPGNARIANSSGGANPPAVASATATTATDGKAPYDQAPGNAAAPGSNAAASDAAAQAAMAAAIAQGKGPSPDPTSPAADSTLPDAGPQGAAAAQSAPAGAPAAALAHASPAMSAAVTAATAGRIAQEVSSAAGIGAADKRSHADSPGLSLSAASNDGSAGAAQLLTSNTSIDSSPSPTLKVAAGVDTPGFGQGVADKVSVMMDGNLTSAKLQVNPPALGPIEVRIALQGGHAQVWLSSHSAVTRDALELSSPKLREMLGSQGFSQVSVDISQRSFQDRSPPSQAYEATPSIEGVSALLAPASASISRSAIGLLDAYA